MLHLSIVQVSKPVLAVRGRAEPGIGGNTGVTQGVHVRPILFDPRAYLARSTDGPVPGDEDINVIRHALEQLQRCEIVLDRVSGRVQVEHRDQDIGQHVTGGEDSAIFDQQRRVTRGMPAVLDDPDSRAVPRKVGQVDG